MYLPFIKARQNLLYLYPANKNEVIRQVSTFRRLCPIVKVLVVVLQRVPKLAGI